MSIHPLKRIAAAEEAVEVAVGEHIIAWLRRHGWACRLGIHDWRPVLVNFVFDLDTYHGMECCKACGSLRRLSDPEEPT